MAPLEAAAADPGPGSPSSPQHLPVRGTAALQGNKFTAKESEGLEGAGAEHTGLCGVRMTPGAAEHPRHTVSFWRSWPPPGTCSDVPSLSHAAIPPFISKKFPPGTGTSGAGMLPAARTHTWGQLRGIRTQLDHARSPSPRRNLPSSSHPLPPGACCGRHHPTGSRNRPCGSSQPGHRSWRAPSSRRHARGIDFCERRGAGNVPGRRRPPTSARAGGDMQKAVALRELWARFRGAITPTTPNASHPERLRQSQARAGVGELPRCNSGG